MFQRHIRKETISKSHRKEIVKKDKELKCVQPHCLYLYLQYSKVHTSTAIKTVNHYEAIDECAH